MEDDILSRHYSMAISIRPARKDDQQIIVSLIRQARINPRVLHWQNFFIAEKNGLIIGIRQVKVHKQGTREVASGFVLPEHRHRGISSQLMNEILRRESGTLYLLCNKKWKKYYEQFGFRDVRLGQLPQDFYREYLTGKIITMLIAVFTVQDLNIIPMKRAGNSSSGDVRLKQS